MFAGLDGKLVCVTREIRTITKAVLLPTVHKAAVLLLADIVLERFTQCQRRALLQHIMMMRIISDR